MNKKQVKASKMTIYDKANALLLLRKEQKVLKEREEALVEELRAHVQDTGEKDLQGVMAYEKTNPAKLEGLDNKALDVAKEQLMNELPDTYVKRALDMNKMYAALGTDKALVGHLYEKGLQITQSREIYFKESK